MTTTNRAGRYAFTLIELLVVLAIVGLLAALLLAAVAASRESGRRMHCANNLKQIGIALHSYMASTGVFPPGYTTGLEDRTDETGPCWGWGAMTLMQLEQSATYNAINFAFKMSDASEQTARSSVLSAFLCPGAIRGTHFAIEDQNSDFPIVPDLAVSHYVASAGRRRKSRSPVNSSGSVTSRTGMFDGAIYRNCDTRAGDFADGMGTTFLVGERSPDDADATWVGTLPFGDARSCSRKPAGATVCVNTNVLVIGHVGVVLATGGLDQPNSEESAIDGFSSNHAGGAAFVFGDGSTRFVRNSISPVVFSALATRAGGEIISTDDL